MKLTLPFLETMATQACNLSCEGCTNYSDLNHNGYITWADMKAQLRPDGDKFILDNKEIYAELFRTCPYMAQSSWEYGATKYENYLDNVNDDININNKQKNVNNVFKGKN